MMLINHPVLCNYYVTYRCNASCSFCDIWERPSPYIQLDNFKQNLLALKKLNVKVIDFTGGEPLLHRQIDVMCRMAKEMGFITTITTNTLLYPKWAEKLKGLVDMLHFSLDSSDKEKHDGSRGVACFDKFVESIELALSLGERPDILFTVGSHNVYEIEAVYKKFCLPNNLVLILNPLFEYNGLANENLPERDDLEKLRKWGKKKLVYLNDAFIDLRISGGNNIYSPVCKAGSSTIVISPENKLILPCYHLGIKEFEIANNLFELYHSKDVQSEIAKEGILPACQGCTINCYMQPSFAVDISRYWFKALPSTFKYNYMKGTWKRIFGF
jgi:MoaA/NifB/PqqE/SkfB family radical SAM enzyme